MIVDAHTHITEDGKWFHTTHDASISRLLREMDEAEVDKAACLAIYPNITNSFVGKIVTEHQDRLWGLGSVDPTKPDAIAAVKLCKEKYNFVGLKLHPRLSGWDFSNPQLIQTLTEVERLGMYVLIDSFLYSRTHIPRRPIYDEIAEIAVALPNLQIVVAHAGFHETLGMSQVARVFENIWLDLSFSIDRFQGSSVWTDLQYACRTLPQKVIWGTDFPEMSIRAYLKKSELLWAEFSSEEKQGFLSGNWFHS